MALRVVGAGLGRTGTNSLKLALEQLLGGRCYHMIEVFGRPDDVPQWHAAARGENPDWDAVFDGYVAAVDWPAAAFWRAIAERYPDAIILLSTRADAETWWRSADNTIFSAFRREAPPDMDAWAAMVQDVFRSTFTTDVNDRAAAVAAYEAHNADVRATAGARLVEWQPGDGWEPLCAALGVPVPDAPFPHVNTTDEFRAMAHLDEPV
jgi:hypothetical protein